MPDARGDSVERARGRSTEHASRGDRRSLPRRRQRACRRRYRRSTTGCFDDAAGRRRSARSRRVLDALAIGADGEAAIPFRAHLFVAPRSEASGRARTRLSARSSRATEQRRVGKLYRDADRSPAAAGRASSSFSTATSAATSRSAASSPTSTPTPRTAERTLVPQPVADLAGSAARAAVMRRRYGEYMWYWPWQPPTDVDSLDSTRPPEQPSATSLPVHRAPTLDHRTGLLTPGSSRRQRDDAQRRERARRAAPRAGASRALPALRPRGVNRKPRIFFRGVVRSPIRAHTTGTAASTQVILDRVVNAIGETPDDAKTIIFTDSRDDAAATAAGVELNHFRDLVRQLMTTELEAHVSPASYSSARGADEPLEHADERDAAELIQRERPDVWAAYRSPRAVPRSDDGRALIEEFERGTRGTRRPARLGRPARRASRRRWCSLGVNPAGPAQASSELAEGQPWWRYLLAPDGEMGAAPSCRSRDRRSRRPQQHLSATSPTRSSTAAAATSSRSASAGSSRQAPRSRGSRSTPRRRTEVAAQLDPDPRPRRPLPRLALSTARRRAREPSTLPRAPSREARASTAAELLEERRRALRERRARSTSGRSGSGGLEHRARSAEPAGLACATTARASTSTRSAASARPSGCNHDRLRRRLERASDR